MKTTRHDPGWNFSEFFWGLVGIVALTSLFFQVYYRDNPPAWFVHGFRDNNYVFAVIMVLLIVRIVEVSRRRKGRS